MSKEVHSQKTLALENRFSQINEGLRAICLKASRQLTDSIYSGLDVSSEIQSVQAQGLGETILLWDQNELVGFAVCHVGAGTEAGTNTCLIKFAVVRLGVNASQAFEQLLDLCEGLTTIEGMLRLVAGVNTAREQAYLKMLDRGFRTQVIGVAMNKPNLAGYNLPEVFVVDDWR